MGLALTPLDFCLTLPPGGGPRANLQGDPNAIALPDTAEVAEARILGREADTLFLTSCRGCGWEPLRAARPRVPGLSEELEALPSGPLRFLVLSQSHGLPWASRLRGTRVGE